ncbi:hypothetical protein [Embleya sp. MST-111070]|uniref:hypothetical protein n=1 Tax=Embleya sp. MST-111070 TaxID=3398231 RepID=UPI003F73FA1D
MSEPTNVIRVSLLSARGIAADVAMLVDGERVNGITFHASALDDTLIVRVGAPRGDVRSFALSVRELRCAPQEGDNFDDTGTDALHVEMSRAIRELDETSSVRMLWERLDESLTAGGPERLPTPWHGGPFNRCQGHESLDGAHMGETVYCDGSCSPA